jgi:hypothetical protein
MRQILCVIDLTESSVAVLNVAAKVASAYQSNLTVLYPYRLVDYGYTGDLIKLRQNLELEAHEKFSLIKKRVEGMDHLSFEFQPEIGFTSDRINSYINKNSPDMIIIGQVQANMIDEVNGITLQNLIKNLKLPFMLVPMEMDVKSFLTARTA